MADKYNNFQELSSAERMGVDFQIRIHRRLAAVAIIAPHGGKIEIGTCEIAAAIAADAYSFYCFEGIKPRHNGDLHITSARFDEPKCLALISVCDLVVALHGCRGNDQSIYLGGRDEDLRDAIHDNLEGAGFTTGLHANPDLQGVSSANVCNRGRRRQGVQLEISEGLRSVLLQASQTEGAGTLFSLANAVRRAIDDSLDY